MYIKLFLVYTFVKLYNGQLLSDLFPTIQVTENEISDPPLLATVARAQDTLSTVFNAIPVFPNALSEIVERIQFPFYSNSVTNARAEDRFLIEFEYGSTNEDATLNFTSLVNKYGFDVESHEVVTEDGYVLSLFRIIGTGTPVFLMHGLLGSADDFIIAGPDSGLVYLLAERGQEVWLGNARGNKYSRRHITMHPTESSFWDFSWHEIGIYDLPAMINYILHKTNKANVTYIGHSQGTTAFFVMASEKPEFNKKVSAMIALSPVAFMKNVRSPIVRILAPGTTILQGVSMGLGLYEFLPDSNYIKILKNIVCGTSTMSEILCSNVIFLVTGFDFEQLNVTNLPVVFGHFPSGASIKQFVHYGQGVISEEFRKFDFGSIDNMEKYGTMVPPNYPLHNIEIPIYLFFSQSDWLAHPRDVAFLSNKLKNILDVYRIPFENFNHIDFILAKDVKTLVYSRVINIVTSYN